MVRPGQCHVQTSTGWSPPRRRPCVIRGAGHSLSFEFTFMTEILSLFRTVDFLLRTTPRKSVCISTVLSVNGSSMSVRACEDSIFPQDDGTRRSNQSLEPTAGRCEVHI